MTLSLIISLMRLKIENQNPINKLNNCIVQQLTSMHCTTRLHLWCLQTSTSSTSTASSSAATRRKTWKRWFYSDKIQSQTNCNQITKEDKKIYLVFPSQTLSNTTNARGVHYPTAHDRLCIASWVFFAGEDPKWRRSWWILGRRLWLQRLVWLPKFRFKRLVRKFVSFKACLQRPALFLWSGFWSTIMFNWWWNAYWHQISNSLLILDYVFPVKSGVFS